MSRGFLLIGINTEQNNMHYAYATALSIKRCDPEASICILVDQGYTLPKTYEHVFDYISELPFGNSAFKDGFHGMNIWQIRHVTPYTETIYVDYDTLFINVDIELLWERLSSRDMAMPSLARTYRNGVEDKRSLFEFEKNYEFPELYNSFIYFKKDSQLALDWFKMADPVFQNWRDVYSSLMKEKKPDTFSKNVLANIVTHLLDCKNEVSFIMNDYYDFDIRSQWLWNSDMPNEWTEVLNYWFPENKKLIVENSVISSGIVHYRDENFITDEIINEYRTQIDIDNRRKAAS